MAFYPVPAGAEWRRIDALTRRTWRKEDARALAEAWSPLMLNPQGLDMWNHCLKLTPAGRERELRVLAERGTPIRIKPEQAMILREFVDCRGVFVAAPVGAGKCSRWDTQIRDPRNGELRTIRDCVNTLQSCVGSWCPERGIVTEPISGHWPTGEKRCLKLTTASGRSISVTPEHPMLTPEGWMRADALRVGFTVAQAARMPEPTEPVEMSDAELDLLGVLFAEGSLSQATSGFSTPDTEVVELMTRAADAFDCDVHYRSGYDYSIVKRAGIRNAVTDLTRDQGIRGLSKRKSMPRGVWSLPTHQLARFVGRVWGCDGYVSKTGIPGITLASEKAVREIQHLLLRFGVQSSVHYKHAQCGGKGFDSWRLSVYSSTVDAFVRHLAPFMWGEKKRRLESWKNTNPNAGNARMTASRLREITAAWANDACPKRRRGRRSVHEHVAPSYSSDAKRDGVVRLGSNWRALCAEYRPDLLWITDSGIWWDVIVSIEDDGVQEVYDLTVEGTHNYIANDFVAHNTLSAYLITLLSSLYFGTTRPVLYVPASLVDDATNAHNGFAKVWQIPRPMPRIESYELLGQPQNEFRLCACPKCTRGADDVPAGAEHRALTPDLIVLDESSKVRNPDAAVSKRMGRYIANHTPVCAPMTGTPIRKSLRNFNRPLVWALHYGTPLPMVYKDLDEWCGALDEKPREGRRPPGALVRWYEGPPVTELEAARRGVQRRLAETPGVIVIDEMSCDQPISIRVLEVPPDPDLDQAFLQFRATDATLDGWALGDVFSVMRYGTELGCGFYSRWDPRPPAWYVDARTTWKRHVKDRIDRSQHSGRPIDREGVVARLDSHLPVYLDWLAAKQRFGKPNSVAVPVTYSTLAYAAQWIQHNGPGLVWVQHTWVGESLSRMTGVPYFAGKGKTSGGSSIRNHPPSKSAILSAHANSYGRNLQAWNVNLVIGPEHSAERWEQQIGRTHRYGQERPVHYDVLATSAESLQALDAAISEAHNAEQTSGIRQKLLTASWNWANVTPEALDPTLIDPSNKGRRARWTRRGTANKRTEEQ